jgi:hypothetical protein
MSGEDAERESRCRQLIEVSTAEVAVEPMIQRSVMEFEPFVSANHPAPCGDAFPAKVLTWYPLDRAEHFLPAWARRESSLTD